MLGWMKQIKKSMIGKLVLSIMIIWIPVSAVVISGIATLSAHITKEAIENQTDKVKYYSAILNTDLERVMQSMEQLCANKTVVDFLNGWNGKVDYKTYLLYRGAYSTLKEYRNTSMYIDDIYVYIQHTGQLLSASRSVITEEDKFQEMLHEYRKDGTSFFSYEDDLYYLFRSSNGILCGMKVSLKDVRYTLRGYDTEGNYNYFFVEAKTFSLLGKQTSIAEMDRKVYNAVDWNGEKLQEAKIDGNRYLVYQIGRNANGFLILMYMNRSEAYAVLYALYWVWGMTTLLLLLVPVVLSMVIRKIIKSPIDKLQKAMEMVEHETYDYRLAINESKEFNYIFEQYNKMTQKVSNLIQEVLEKQVQVEQARYKQLQLQINPHFLFNSLYMGYRMAQAEDCEAVGDLCMYLGDYFAVLTYVANDNISVENELKFTTTYLKLNQMRFGEKLCWRLENEKETDDYRIPPLLLQPLIENAIFHGMEKCSHPCTIVVSLHWKNERLVFCVEDNADVITKEAIDALRQSIEQEKMPEKHFGLWNIQRRLKQLDRGNKGLKFVRDGEKFKVSFSVVATNVRSFSDGQTGVK